MLNVDMLSILNKTRRNRMKHKHSELIKAWADGAIIQFKFGDTYRSFKQNKVDWASCSNDTLRIKPDCQYAIDRIESIESGANFGTYVFWISGGDIEIFLGTYSFMCDPTKPPRPDTFTVANFDLCEDPYHYFTRCVLTRASMHGLSVIRKISKNENIR
jgi:hypothetical protein